MIVIREQAGIGVLLECVNTTMLDRRQKKCG